MIFGSRDAGKAETVAASCSAQAGDFDDACAFAEAVLGAVRDVLPSSLLRSPRGPLGRSCCGVTSVDSPKKIREQRPEHDASALLC